MKAVLLGATAGLGRALARCLAERGDELFLLGRDRETLLRSAADLELRGAAAPVCGTRCDLRDGASIEPALAAAEAALGKLDLVVVSAGVFAPQEQLEQDGALRDELLEVDFAATIRFCEAARARLLAKGGGTLCVFSSVSGDVPRRRAVLYGAAKAGLSFYLEGLDRRHRREGLRTVLVKPGFVRTSMTAGLEPPPFSGDPEPVARRVLLAIERGWPVVYAPPVWRLVMLALRLLPRAVLRRLDF